MSVSAASLYVAPTPNASSDFSRSSANFHPTIWGDHFIQYASERMLKVQEVDDKMEEHIKILKEEVRNMLVPATEKALRPLTVVNLIDSVQRLGLYYHFEREIDEALQHIHNNYVENGIITLNEDLHSLALLFRLLRQQGYRISPDVFNKFKGEKGDFDIRLMADFEGMLSLYEAAHLRVHGEYILDEALAFTSTHLESISTQLSPSLAAQVNYSLKQPLHRGLPRIEARRYISIYQQDPLHNETLLALAKLDFNMLQNLHRKEFGNICKWWKELDVARKQPFVRDRIVEGCFWIMSVYFEPKYSLARNIMVKVGSMISIIDDTYDAYGTIEELELYTKAVERWDRSCLDDLPEYMKVSYELLLNVFEEIEQEMRKEGRAFSVNYGKEEIKKITQAGMTEARWLNSNYIPTAEEYMSIATVSNGYPLLTTTSYIGMEDAATEDIFKWVTSKPKIVQASSIICRLMDDIVSNEFEQKRGHVASFLECYMRQYGKSREDAIHECRKRITNAWKDMNEECLRPTKVPMPFLMRALNLARFMDVMYKDQDNYTHAGGVMKTYIKALLVDPVPI